MQSSGRITDSGLEEAYTFYFVTILVCDDWPEVILVAHSIVSVS